MTMWKKTFAGVCLAIALTAAMPAAVLADAPPPPYDARIESYAQTVQLDAGSTALTWLLLVVLGVVTLGVLFMDAKRSHLD